MEFNTTKQSVSSYETVFEQTIEQAVDTDFTLPEYYPAIVRILKCKILPKISSKSVSADALNIEGASLITVIYTDDEGKIYSYEYEIPFKKSVPVGDVGELPQIQISMSQEYANVRAITQRKLDVHGVLSVKITILRQKNVEIITDIDCEGIQLKGGSCPATNPLGYSEKIVVIEEDLELSHSSSAIKSIIRCDSRAVLEQCKLIGNKAVIKGDVILNALYCTVNGSVEKYESRIPFNQIVDMAVSGEDCECDAELNMMYSILKPRTNLSGEAKSFSFECKLSIIALASCDNDIPIVYDAFCTKHDLNINTGLVRFKKLESTLNERFICKKMLEFSENTFGSIIDIWCENKAGQTKLEDGNLSLSGTAVVCLLLYDGDDQPQYFERSIDYEYNNNLKEKFDSSIVDAEIIPTTCAYTVISENKLEVRVELSLSAAIFKNQIISVVLDSQIGTENTNQKKKAPIIVYYASEKEDIWDIAKAYRSDCADIMSINELDDDILSTARVLLIP